MSRKPVFGQDVSRPSCGSHHVVKCGRPLGRQKRLCRDCGKCLLGDATYHSRKLREDALRMYANGMSMRAISRVLNVPLSTVFTWIKRYGREKHEKLVELWAASMDFRFPWSSNEFTITRWLSTSFTPPTYLLDGG